MVNINIAIDDELHKKIKLKALLADTTLKDHIIEVMQKRIDNSNNLPL